VVVPQLALGDEVQDQLQAMQDRMAQLEAELDRSNQKVERQEAMMEDAGMGESSALSSLSSFLEKTEIGGWVAASYFWNFNDPSTGYNGGQNNGSFGTANPFHPDHNTFNIDQAWFEVHKPATEESRGGFGIDMVMGKTSDTLAGGGGDGNANNVTLYQAYVEYLAPIGNGVNVKAGRFATVIGVEVAQTVYNFNITRGLVYSVLQPFNHVGVLASTELGAGFDMAVGAVNTSVSNASTDFDQDKSVLWHVGWSGDTVAVGVNGVWGGDNYFSARAGPPCPSLVAPPPPPAAPATPDPTDGTCRNSDKLGIVDLVVSWDPSEKLSTYINFDYLWTTDSKSGGGADPQGYGVAMAGRYAITETTGFALRGEYVRSEDNLIFGGGSGKDQDLWSLTSTLDHMLTDNLQLKGEIRYEQGKADGGSDNIFYLDGAGAGKEKNQVLIGTEVSYRF
jgi:hypothetical protein